jgi:hypothetical protein
MSDRPICLIDQPAGLGDICFIQKLIDRVINDGYDVELPVNTAYSWVSNYIRKPHLKIYPERDDEVRKIDPPNIFIPLRNSGMFYPHMPIISAKYHMLRMNYLGWQDHFDFARYPEKEEELFSRLQLTGPYNLVSRRIQSPPKTKSLSVNIPQNGLHTVEIVPVEGFTAFDWSTVIERATHLFFVDSCFTFICEKLNLVAKSMNLISRAHEEGGVHESAMTLHMFRKPWRLFPQEFKL